MTVGLSTRERGLLKGAYEQVKCALALPRAPSRSLAPVYMSVFAANDFSKDCLRRHFRPVLSSYWSRIKNRLSGDHYICYT